MLRSNPRNNTLSDGGDFWSPQAFHRVDGDVGGLRFTCQNPRV
jgi:hypothetical protein